MTRLSGIGSVGCAALAAACLFAPLRAPAAAVAQEAGPTWYFTDLGSSGDNGSLAVGTDGSVHTCWLDRGELRYAVSAGGDFATETVDTPGEGYGLTYSSWIALDSTGAAHIAYDGTEQLRYATNASGDWVVTTVDAPGFDVGDDACIAIDSADHAHIAYLDRQNGHLRYATNASGDWAITDLGSGGYASSIAVGPGDGVHIVHNRFAPSGQLAWTRNTGGGWSTSALGATTGYYNSIAVDGDGHIHVSWFNGALNYGTDASGAFTPVVVDAAPGVAANSSIALAPDGTVHITYEHYGLGDLRYATDASGAWQTSLVDGDGEGDDDLGYFSSLAVDADGALHVIYTNRGAGEQRYATTRVPSKSTLFKGVAAKDGWILEKAQGSGTGGKRNTAGKTLAVGDDAKNRQCRGLLTFQTKGLPDDAVIVSATLRLRWKPGSGADPGETLGDLLVDVGGPRFGTSPGLQPSDFETPAGVVAAAALEPTDEFGVAEAKLPAEALLRIDRAGFTQFRLRFENATDGDGAADRVLFWTGNAKASLRPVLEVRWIVP